MFRRTKWIRYGLRMCSISENDLFLQFLYLVFDDLNFLLLTFASVVVFVLDDSGRPLSKVGYRKYPTVFISFIFLNLVLLVSSKLVVRLGGFLMLFWNQIWRVACFHLLNHLLISIFFILIFWTADGFSIDRTSETG